MEVCIEQVEWESHILIILNGNPENSYNLSLHAYLFFCELTNQVEHLDEEKVVKMSSPSHIQREKKRRDN